MDKPPVKDMPDPKDPKIIRCDASSDFLTVTFEDGLVHKFSRRELQLPSEILECSVGVSGFVVGLLLVDDQETRGFAAKYLRDVAGSKVDLFNAVRAAPIRS